MQKRWLLVSVIMLFLGATIFGMSLYTQTNYHKSQVEIGNQTGASIIQFTLPVNYSGIVIFNASGVFQISNSTQLKVINQTGSIEYYKQIQSFPIQAQLFNSSGEYSAYFEQMSITNSTLLSVTTEVTTTSSSYPYDVFILLGSPIVLIGLAIFPLGIQSYFLKGLKKGNDEQKYYDMDKLSILIHSFSFAFFIFMLLLLTYVVPSIGMGSLEISVVISIFFSAFCFILYWKIAKFVSKIDIKSCSDQIITIQWLAKLTSYAYYSAFLFLIPMILFYYAGLPNILLQIFTVVMILSIFDTFFDIFRRFTPQGNAIIYLSSFIQDFRKNNCSAKFNLISKASKMITKLIKPYNIMVSSEGISCSLSYYAITFNDATKFTQLLKEIEKRPIEYPKLLPLVEGIAGHSNFLESQGLKGLPSFSDKYGKVISIIVSVATAIIAIITFIQKII